MQWVHLLRHWSACCVTGFSEDHDRGGSADGTPAPSTVGGVRGRGIGFVSRLLICVVMGSSACTTCLAVEGGWVSVRRYLPETWPSDGTVDLRDSIQKALAQESMLFFPGGTANGDPLVYPVSCTLDVPAGHRIRFAPYAWLRRLPSEGPLLSLGDGVHLTGAVIDGNKVAHWPAFKELGKSDAGVKMRHHCVLEDVVVFNNPGIAFFSYGSYNKLYRCRAENVGYIDVKFGAVFYQGKWDKWSGDGFYFRGTGNLIKDCDAYDCFRWDYCSSHSGARQNTYVDCRGGDVNLRTYGFIDIEGAEENNRLVRCTSPNSGIAIPGSPRTEVVDCMASQITLYDHQNKDSVAMYGSRAQAPRIEGCMTTEGGIVLGGWSSQRNKLVPGAVAPVVTNNRMYKMHSGPSDAYSDWSFSVHSVDGSGVVANNILFEFDDGYTRGPGMHLENVKGLNNQVVYGQWTLKLAKPAMRYGSLDEDTVSARQLECAREALARLYEEQEGGGSIASVTWLRSAARFVRDPEDAGEEEGWAEDVSRSGESAIPMPFGRHWDFRIGRYNGVGWYMADVSWPENENAPKYLFLAGIDSEAKVYLDGVFAGSHSGWNTPSLVRLPPETLTQGDHTLALKVWTPGGMGGVYGPVGLVTVSGEDVMP